MMKIEFDLEEEAKRLKNNFKRLFLKLNDPFSTAMKKSFGNVKQPLADITHSSNKIIITIDILDVKPKDVELNITKNFVEFKVEKTNKKTTRKNNVYKKVESSQKYYRMIKLPSNLNHKKAKAKFKKGKLEIIIPRKIKKK